MFQKRALKGIFDSKSVAATGFGSKLHYEELHNLYSETNIKRMIKSVRIRRVGKVWERREMHTTFW
jgi:hypothetical protein